MKVDGTIQKHAWEFSSLKQPVWNLIRISNWFRCSFNFQPIIPMSGLSMWMVTLLGTSLTGSLKRSVPYMLLHDDNYILHGIFLYIWCKICEECKGSLSFGAEMPIRELWLSSLKIARQHDKIFLLRKCYQFRKRQLSLIVVGCMTHKHDTSQTSSWCFLSTFNFIN